MILALSIAATVLLVAFISWWAVGRLIPILQKQNIVDESDSRRLHSGSIARGGGLVIIALLCGALIAVGITSGRYALFGSLLISCLLWGGLSWTDDRIQLSPKVRWISQCLFGILIILAFGYVNSVQLSTQLTIELGLFGAVLSYIGLLWFANLFNFMDGMDGLAASQAIIASITLAVWLFGHNDYELGLVMLSLAAACYGFLIWNLHPAKIFLGDVGSVSLGAFFAILIIWFAARYDMPVISLILLFGVFVADATTTLFRRLFKGEKIWLPHRSHYYQRLSTAGMPQSGILLLAITLMLICSLIATMTLLYRDTIGLGISLELAVLVISMFFVRRFENLAKN